MSTFSPTPEQEAIILAAKQTSQNLMISAYAGAAKTSTLVLVAQTLKTTPILALAFNVRIKKELESRLPSLSSVKTLNGLGHYVWGQTLGKRLILKETKLATCIKEVAGDLAAKDWDALRRLTMAATHAGMLPAAYADRAEPASDTTWTDLCDDLGVDEKFAPLAQKVMEQKISQSFLGEVDFDDQIYMSALFGAPSAYPQFPLLFVDEAQDLSPLNHRQVAAMRKSRLMVVGDRLQAIYGFRGAHTQSMEQLRGLRPAETWRDLTLSVTFRCPQAIVARQQAHAPGYTAGPGAPAGEVRTAGAWGHRLLEPGTAVLCRNNAPLVKLAFKLLRKQIGVVFLGRDLGKNLVGLSKKICPKDDTPIGAVFEAVGRWRDREEAALRARNQDSRVEGVYDRAECLFAVGTAENVHTAGDLRARLELIFSKDKAPITLSSIHRAKGLEWRTVVHLDPWRIPSKYAKSEAEIVQEHNLKYVCETRSQHALIEVNLEDFNKQTVKETTQ